MLAKSFEGLPPTHIITAEFDICRDEARRYGELLAKSNNHVTQKCYLGMPHAFGHYTHPEKGLTKGYEYIQDTSRLLREAHGLFVVPRVVKKGLSQEVSVNSSY
jgi:acetyl esterase/lipase